MTDFDEPTTDEREEQDSAVDAEASQNGDESATVAGDDLEERLVAEGEIAGDYLEELLDLLDFDGDIDLDVEGDRAVVSDRRRRRPDQIRRPQRRRFSMRFRS